MSNIYWSFKEQKNCLTFSGNFQTLFLKILSIFIDVIHPQFHQKQILRIKNHIFGGQTSLQTLSLFLTVRREEKKIFFFFYEIFPVNNRLDLSPWLTSVCVCSVYTHIIHPSTVKDFLWSEIENSKLANERTNDWAFSAADPRFAQPHSDLPLKPFSVLSRIWGRVEQNLNLSESWTKSGNF